MPCYRPIRAYRNSGGSVFFSELARHGDLVEELDLPCGGCVGCRLERSRQWATRIMHESQLHEFSCVVTLTYDDEHLPAGGTLVYRDVQLFLKRARQRLGPFRFFCCGEYGSESLRPHYHAVLFGIRFPDLVELRAGKVPLWTSRTLDMLWRLGMSSIGDVTFASAAYVARYVVDKLDPQSERRFVLMDRGTGELSRREQEFVHMSLRPGIGSGWLERYVSDVYPDGRCVFDGRLVKPPKFYDRRYGREHPDEMASILLERSKVAKREFGENFDERLKVREQVARAGVSQRKRSYE